MRNRHLALVGLIAALLWSGVIWAQRKEEYRARDIQLQHYYDGYNREFFDDLLPHNIPVYYDDELIKLHSFGRTHCEDWNDPTTCKIRISPKYEENAIWQENLFHEMCHVAVGYKDDDPAKTDEENAHGKHWTTCMVRLAEAGAFKGIW